jgi:hypothetical protein
MQVSKIPVDFANRAEMIECDQNAFSVCAHIPENRVYVNLYVDGKTRVIGMTADEARELSRALAIGADDLQSLTADPDYMRQLNAKLRRERQDNGE